MDENCQRVCHADLSEPNLWKSHPGGTGSLPEIETTQLIMAIFNSYVSLPKGIVDDDLLYD